MRAGLADRRKPARGSRGLHRRSGRRHQKADPRSDALQDWFKGLGELKTLTFQRVTESGADEYLVEFATGKLRIDMGLDTSDRMDRVYFEPR